MLCNSFQLTFSRGAWAYCLLHVCAWECSHENPFAYFKSFNIPRVLKIVVNSFQIRAFVVQVLWHSLYSFQIYGIQNNNNNNNKKVNGIRQSKETSRRKFNVNAINSLHCICETGILCCQHSWIYDVFKINFLYSSYGRN